MMDPGIRRSEIARKSYWLRGLHLLTLSSWAVLQPLLERLGAGTDFLVAHGVRGLDLLFLVLALCLVPAFLLFTIQRLLPSPWRSGFHLLSVQFLSGLIFMPPLARLGLPDPVHWLFAISAAVLLAAGYHRLASIRSFVTLISPSILVFPLVFLLWSPARDIWQSSRSDSDWAEIAADTPIVFLILDELPLASLLDDKNEIDRERYPNLARLASMSRWFRNATTVAESTTAALPAILTGLYPEPGKSALFSNHPNSLFTLLGGTYRMEVIETATAICPDDLCGASAVSRPRLSWSSLSSDLELLYLHLVLPARAAARLPPITGSLRDFRQPRIDGPSNLPPARGGDVVNVFEKFLEAIQPHSEPTLHFLHLNLPHLPWRYLPSGIEYGPVGLSIYPHGFGAGIWSEQEWHTIQALQRHLLQVGFVDRLIGRLLDRLEAQGRLENAALVVTADHGTSFLPGQPRRKAIDKTAADVLRIPLFIKPPGPSHGEIDDRRIESVDILPTLAEALDIQIPWVLDGRSFLASDASERDRRVFVRTTGEIVGEENVPDALDLSQSVLRIRTLFGEASSDLYRIGPHPELIDQPLSELEIQGRKDIRVDLIQPWFFSHVDLESRFRPSQVEGSIRGNDLGLLPLELAVSVNGTIRAVTYSYQGKNGLTHFSAMFPPSVLKQGANRIEIFVIRGEYLLGPQDGPTQLEARLVSRRGRSRILVSDRDPIQISKDKLHGYLIGDKMFFHAWAADLVSGQPAQQIIVFIDERLIIAASPSWKKSSKVAPGRIRDAIFRFPIPFSLIDDPAAANVRFFATRGDSGSEIFFQMPSTGEVRWEIRADSQGGEVLVDEHDRVLPVVPGQVQGFIDRRRRHGKLQNLGGWAVDPRTAHPVDEVVAFRGTSLIATAERQDRPLLATELGLESSENLGFLLRIERGKSEERIRVFGVLREAAIVGEIPWHPRLVGSHGP